MENKAHYALIGTFVVLAFIAVIAAATWLSGSGIDKDWDEYVVEFSGPVRGLTRGSEVRLNGLGVGEVTDLDFDPNDPNLVIVTVQVIDGTPIFKNGFAQLEPLGLTGLNYIQINPGDIALGRMDAKNQNIPGKMSQFDNFLVGGENVIDGATMAIRRINVLLSEETITDLQGILNNVNQMTDNLKDADVDPVRVDRMLKAIEQAGKDISGAATSIKGAADSLDVMLNSDVAPVFTRAQTSMDRIDSTLDDYASLAQTSTLAAQDVRDAINRLSNSGLADMEETTDAMRNLMITLSNIADQLEKSPAQFIAGEKREVMELPQ